MDEHELIAFYKSDATEVAFAAEEMGALYQLRIRYEQIPGAEDAIGTLLSPQTVVCIFNREVFRFRKLLKYVYALARPVIIVHSKDKKEAYSHLKVPVGYLQENKEKVVWANFFQHRNARSTVEMVIPKEKDEDIAFMVKSNEDFIENVFKNSGAHYTKTYVNYSFEKSLKNIFVASSDCIIFLMRPFRVFSLYIPLNLRIFRKYAHTPALIIPRDDALYVPCH